MTSRLIVIMALKAISHHKGRSFLTILGIVIGIAGIIATMAIGRGAQKKAREQILAKGSKSIDIQKGNWAANDLKKEAQFLSQGALYAIKSQIPQIEYITPGLRAWNRPLEYQGKTAQANIFCTNKHIFSIEEKELCRGSFFTSQHVKNKENVCIIDHEAASVLFKTEDPLQQIIRIDQMPFTVIGVLKPPAIKSRWDLGKLSVYIPLTAGQKLYNRKKHRYDFFFLSTFEQKDNPEVIRIIRRILRADHKIEENEPDDFLIWDTQAMAEVAEGGSKIIGLFALIAASIALLVGGIGVMNIMLVAVQERTKEIGIKLALGATPTLIQRQFLLEAIFLCITGGIIGIGLGVGISLVLAQCTTLPAFIELLPILIAFVITTLIGLAFGYYPARKASQMNPVDALLES